MFLVSCGGGGHYKEKRNNRRFTYEAVVRGGMYREKRKNWSLCTYEYVVRGGGHVQCGQEREEGMYRYAAVEEGRGGT